MFGLFLSGLPLMVCVDIDEKGGVGPSRSHISTFLHTTWVFAAKKTQNVLKKTPFWAILGTLPKFQSALPPKVLGIRANH